MSPAFSKTGFLSGDYIRELIDRLIRVQNIEDLSMPYAAVATDLNVGEPVTFTSGSIKSAVRASIAIPGIFTPVTDSGRFLVDGGVLDPVPVRAVRNLGADKVIAVDLVSSYKLFSEDTGVRRFLRDLPFQDELDNIGDFLKSIGESLYLFEGRRDGSSVFSSKTVLDIIQRISVITQSKLIELSFAADPPDVIIRPDVSNIGIFDFHKGRQGIDAGIISVESNIDEIREVIS